MISSSQRPLLDNTQQSQQTDIHAHGVIQTRNPSKPPAADPRLRPRGHWDLHLLYGFLQFSFNLISLNILQKTFLSKPASRLAISSLNAQDSAPYVTTGLINL